MPSLRLSKRQHRKVMSLKLSWWSRSTSLSLKDSQALTLPMPDTTLSVSIQTELALTQTLSLTWVGPEVIREILLIYQWETWGSEKWAAQGSENCCPEPVVAFLNPSCFVLHFWADSQGGEACNCGIPGYPATLGFCVASPFKDPERWLVCMYVLFIGEETEAQKNEMTLQSHPAIKWQSWNSTSGLFNAKTHAPIHFAMCPRILSYH